MTVNDVFVKALALIDEILPGGTYDAGSAADYKGKAPFIVDMYHQELLNYTNKTIGENPIVPITLTDLEDTLQTDDTTSQAIVYGLAYNFMLSEQNDNIANNFLMKYNQLKRELKKKPATFTKITDVYGAVY